MTIEKADVKPAVHNDWSEDWGDEHAQPAVWDSPFASWWHTHMQADV